MFYLHSSADHAFILTRRAPSNALARQGYSFSGSDEPVSWESVRIVKQLVPDPSTGQEHIQFCPICLDSFVSARITICGHCFCLACALRHIQTSTASNPYQHVKCPCCAIPMIVNEMRPVVFEHCRPPGLQKVMKLVKLHRARDCAAPFIPNPNQPKHSSPHAAPCMTDADAKYCRFNFVDPTRYMDLLESDKKELELEIALVKRSGARSVELTFLAMALEIVVKTQKSAQEELQEEKALIERFASPTSGIYQPQSPELMAMNVSLGGGGYGKRLEAPLSDNMADSSLLMPQKNVPPVSSPTRRYRGDSIGSYHSIESTSSKNSDTNSNSSPRRRSRRRFLPASMYLDEGESHFYQSEDGQLVFLNGFNMTCLQADASKNIPASNVGPRDGTTTAHEQYESSSSQSPPLPDYVDGTVLEIDTVHITPEIRKRMPFMSHLPLYTDVIFVELDLNNVLSDETKQRFKNEFSNRRKRRQTKVQAEKRADRVAKREEEERIQERKARMQIIDPSDEFFHVPVQESDGVILTGDDFGPAISANTGNSQHNEGGAMQSSNSASQHIVSPATSVPAVSFSEACRRSENDPLWTPGAFPTLGSSSRSEAFPALASSCTPEESIKEKSTSKWVGHRDLEAVDPTSVSGGVPRTGAINSPAGKKKRGGKKLVLFTTGGQRGGF